MDKNSRTDFRRGVLFTVTVLSLAVAVILLPYKFRSVAGSNQNGGKNSGARTHSHESGLENYDIRTDKKQSAKIVEFRAAQNKNAAQIADTRENFVDGEKELKRRVPKLKVEYSRELQTPEVIATDATQGRAFLTEAINGSRSEKLRNFIKQNDNLIGIGEAQTDKLHLKADYTNPDGNLSFTHFEQKIDNIPVFQGEIKAGFTKSGEIIRVINNLAPAIDEASVSENFGDALNAVKFAAGHINNDLSKLDLTREDSLSDDAKTVFGKGDSATTAEKIYFPTEIGVVVPAWRVLIWQPENAFYVIVDANSGTMLWRKNITEDQTQAATYGVYVNPNAMINVADSPFPISPGPVAPGFGTQGAAINRTVVSRIGNEAPYTFNTNGWINDGVTKTDGNAVQAGLDRDGTDGVDPNSEAFSANRNFVYNYSPGNPNTNTGDAPITLPQTYPGSEFQQGSVTQLFWISNFFHDEMYRFGWTEQALNFQDNNFGRGGLGGDRVRAEGQDSSGTNNANFSTPADGGRGRMQMYLWTGPNPDFDGNLDATVVIHELAHGLSNRLHGNAAGLSSAMARGMGEGWSDFYAHCLLSEPTDSIDGIYTIGAYDTYLGVSGYTANSYYGIRRFPKAIMSATGGANNRPHNPLTFADLDSTQINITDGAFNRGPYGSSIADQVHNAGEIWSSALWEVRAKYVSRLGWETGNRRILQHVTDGMKLAPSAPTFLQERDAIIAAAQASLPAPQSSADVADLWAGFAIRGMGASAVVLNAGTANNDTRVTEAFDLPNLRQIPAITVSDSQGDNDGFPEPGETVSINIPLNNNTGNNALNTTLQIAGGNSVSYGTILNNDTMTKSVNYTVPANTPCGNVLTLTLNVNSSLGATTFTRLLTVGSPLTTFTENFDSVTAPAIPANWTATSVNSGVNFVTTGASSDTAPNSAFALDPTTVGGGTDLTSPVIPIASAGATVVFRHQFNTEAGWDGGVLEVSVNDGAFQDIIAAGGRFIEGGYNGALGTSTNNPLSGRTAWQGNSGGYITTTAQLPASAAGQNIRLRWRFGADDNTAPANGGWNVDSIRVNGNSECSVTPQAVKSRADFDGDGKTDVSVFRPTDGTWYLNRSTSGFTAAQFGTNGDIPAAGDFDGDGKTDVSVFRPSNGTWYRLNSSNGAFSVTQFGTNGDIPAAGDFDGDGKADTTVFRPSNGTWYRLNSGNGQFEAMQFGTNGDIPLVGNFDGDAKSDIAVYRPSNGGWFRINSSNGQFSAVYFGLSTDIPAPADFDGDNKDDVSVFRPSNGTWYRLNSTDGQLAVVQFGANGDVPAAGDYDGDGKDDQAVFRNGTWYLLRSASGFTATGFGIAGDKPIPTTFVP